MKQLITIGLGALLSFNDRSIAMTKERVISPLSAMPLFVRKTAQGYTTVLSLNSQGKERQISFWQDLQIANLPADQKPVRPILASTEEMMELARLFPQRRLIPSQTFRVNLLEWGTCLFVPTISSERRPGELIIHLVKNNRIVLTFPQPSVPWFLFELKAVAFLPLSFAGTNEDGIILIGEYITGVGSEGGKPFLSTLVYQRQSQGRGFKLLEKESRMLSERQVSTIAEAERILRHEFNYLP